MLGRMWMAIAMCAAAGVTAAHADGKFQVDPTRIDLSSQTQTAAVVITNHGKSKLRLELSAVTWREDLDGKSELAPTTDVVIRPSLITVEPGSSRTVRVAIKVAAAKNEQSYRVFFEELPDRGPVVGGQIRVLTRVGVPLFVAPKSPSKTAKISAKVEGGRALVTVENTGSVHAKLAKVKVAAVGPKKRWEHEAAGWYVLPETSRRFAIDLGNDGCGEGDQIEVKGVDEDGVIWSSRGTCER